MEKRVLLSADPTPPPATYLFGGSPWPAKWIGASSYDPGRSCVLAFRLEWEVEQAQDVRLHVSADQQYELFLDGHRVGRGPERGDHRNWFYETYECHIRPGRHVLAARVWWLEPTRLAGLAQVTEQPGFMLFAQGHLQEVLSTGLGAWRYKTLAGYRFEPARIPNGYVAIGARLVADASHIDWDPADGTAGEGWEAAVEQAPVALKSVINERPTTRLLRPALLPEMALTPITTGRVRHVQALAPEDDARAMPVAAANSLTEETQAWQGLLDGRGSVTVPVGERRRVVVDLDDYCCAWSKLIVSGGRGGSVALDWAESLFLDAQGREKGHRDEIEGKLFLGAGDIFGPGRGAGQAFEPQAWMAGRYLQIDVQAGDELLTVESLVMRQTNYPFAFEGSFSCDDARLEAVVPLALRSLMSCSHQTYMDCPYYEQLMYVGDTRLEALVTYATCRDDRLPRKAVEMFDESRTASGMTLSRWPTRWEQTIPPFSLWWIAMVHDYAMWRDDPAFVRNRLPGVRAVLEAYRHCINENGLLQSPAGWNFVDWVVGWTHGMPPGAQEGMNGTLNLHAAMVFRQAAELETWAGEPELAARNAAAADRLAAATVEAFWDESRGLFAEDLGHTAYSEHAQCLALLGGTVSSERRDQIASALLDAPDLRRTTLYFTHYLFETLRLLGRIDRVIDRLEPWFALRSGGFRTTYEMPEPTRSDCHAWGAHPVYHFLATILGVRPRDFGFRTVEIRPQLGPLQRASGVMPHPQGLIRVELERRGTREVTGVVELPDGTDGTLCVADGTPVQSLPPGRSLVTLPT